jgi:hypothetical protein
VVDIVGTPYGLTTDEVILVARDIEGLAAITKAAGVLSTQPHTLRARVAAISKTAIDLHALVSNAVDDKLLIGYLRATDPEIAGLTATKSGLKAFKSQVGKAFDALSALSLIKTIANEIVYDVQTGGQPITEVFEAYGA